MKRVALFVGAFVTVLTLLTGTFLILGKSATTTRRDPIEFTGVRAVRLELRHGGVTLRGTSATSASGTRAITRSFGRPSYSETVEADGTLVLRSRCQPLLSISCSVNYELTVPSNVQVDGYSNAGDIRLSDIDGAVDVNSSAGEVVAANMSGTLRLSSSAGDVRVDGSLGSLDLSTSAGDVIVKNSTARVAKAESSAGDVQFSFANAPDSIEATSTAGDVVVNVGRSASGYAVDASASAGDTKVAIKTDPESPRRMKLRSTAGDVVVRYRTTR